MQNTGSYKPVSPNSLGSGLLNFFEIFSWDFLTVCYNWIVLTQLVGIQSDSLVLDAIEIRLKGIQRRNKMLTFKSKSWSIFLSTTLLVLSVLVS